MLRFASALLLTTAVFLSVSIFLRFSPSPFPLQSFYGGWNNNAAADSSSDSVSVLFPDWEVLVILSPAKSIQSGKGKEEEFDCVYPHQTTSPARFAGALPSTGQLVFKCLLPESLRKKKDWKAPILVRKSSSEEELSVFSSIPEKPLLRWTYLAYESFSTENDVVLFVKGVNNKQAVNRNPRGLRCVFSKADDDDGALTTTTAVTSSDQEVFRCGHPDLTGVGGPNPTRIKISLEILSSGGDETVLVPSVAYYSPRRSRIENPQRKVQICAATMVYNTAKFIREWVIYHSGIGVDKFFIYDNDSDDNLHSVVESLNSEGYKIETVPWIWPKTQEAGFSHAAVYAKETCDWMMYVDVDEFVFSPRWSSARKPSNQMLKTLLSETNSNGSVGQVSIRCNEFGPSGRETNPEEGVMQGYDCRSRVDNRHKSIVLLEAIDDSLQNAVHHFRLRGGGEYWWKEVNLATAVVNHYKYQAWSEFKLKFRRRVSAYVVDWKTAVNMASKDRTPGLGATAVKPDDWERRFCEVKDERLKDVARRWFGGRLAAAA
ncbi:Glycosyltransferase family 92 protein RCOM_0530710 [Linum grandiflorum]